jgi:hypothetical protein
LLALFCFCITLALHGLYSLTVVSRLFMTSMTDVEIMKMTGHTNASTLLRYAHLRSSDVAAKINAKWSPDKFIEAKKPAAKSAARAKKAVPE